MDGIGFIGGPQRLSGVSGFPKAGQSSPEIKNDGINDSLSTGYFGGSEIQDPRKAFAFTGPEVTINPSGSLLNYESSTVQNNAGELTGKNNEASSVGGFFISGSNDGFGDFDLNGPSSLGQGIVSLSGLNLNDSNNPRVLFLE
jgi:hypothetical protein